MSKGLNFTEDLRDYLVTHSITPTGEQQAIVDATLERVPDVAIMQIPAEQGALMTFLAGLVGAELAVEVGTFTGYSALCIARGLADGGRLLCCDVSEEWTAIARRAWARAGVADRIDLRLAPAAETLAALPRDQSIDLGFIDADKPGYPVYYEELLARLRPNGVLLIDNVLWNGNVVKPDADDDNTRAIRAFNDVVAADERVEAVMLPIADGLTLCRKK